MPNDDTAALVGIASDVGAAQANIENLESVTEEIAEKQESLETRQRWNDEALDRAFERIWALEDRISILELKEAEREIEEEEIEELIEETEETEAAEAGNEPTVIEGAEPAAAAAAAAETKPVKTWGVL